MGIRGSLNYVQEIHVAKQPTDLAPKTVAGATTTPIQDAIDLITDNAAGKRYAIIVHPGTYTEKIVLEDYIDLIAAGGREETIITFTATAHDEPTVTGENCLIKGFTIVSDGNVATFRARCVDAATAGFEIEDCVLTPQNTAAAAIALNATASCAIRDCVVDSVGTAATGALFTTAAQTYNVERTSFNGSTDAIQVTLAITALNLTDCTVSDNFNQDGGTVNVARCQIEATDFGTAVCTFSAELTRFTAAVATAGAFAHTLSYSKCSFNGQNFNNAATGATTLSFRGCDGIATLTNAGIGGTLTLYECGVETLTTTQGTVVAYGGRINACGGSTGTTFVWWQTSDELVIMPNMIIAHALTAAAGGGIVILIRPGTYAESNLTLVASVNLVGTDPEQCIISASVATPILNCGVTCAISNLTVTNGDVGGTAITVTANTLTARNCNINGFGAGDAIAMTAGILNAYDCQVGAGDIDLSTAICTLSMYRSLITTDPIDTAGNFAHVLTFEQCDLGNQNLASAAIGATTLTMSGCSHVGQVSNAGTGNFTIRDSDVRDVTTTLTGFITIYGGDVGTCAAAAAGGDIVWWKDDNLIYVLPAMHIEHALTAAGLATGDTIELGHGTWTESNLIAIDGVDIVGQGDRTSIISTGDVANAILNCAVNTNLYNIQVVNTNAGAPAIAVTANQLTIRGCTVSGTGAGDAVTMTAGILIAYETEVGTGDIDLSTAICTLSMFRCRITTDPIDTAGAFAHVLTFEQCDFSNQNLASAATGATTLDMTGCSHVGQLANAGTGAFTVRDSDIGGINVTAAGSVTLYGGDLGSVTRAVGSVVWWKDADNIVILPCATTTDTMVAWALVAAAAGGITIHLSRGTFQESALVAVNNVDIEGDGVGVSLIQATDAANPIIDVGNNVTCQLFSLTIENLGANNAIDIAPVANNSSVVVRDCYIASGADGVTLTTTGAGAPSFEAFNTEFNVTTTTITVSGGVVADVDLHQCEFTCTNMATFTGANHTFDAVNCGGGGGAVTVAANNSVINLTRCNDVGAITNGGTGAITIEHCTTGNITNSSTATVTIETCNCGILAQGAAAGAINAYNSYLTEAQCGADVGAAINLYTCHTVDIDADGGTTTMYGGSVEGLSDTTGTVLWVVAPHIWMVVASTANMKIADALAAAAAGDSILIGAGTFAESGLTAVDGVNFIGSGRDISIISAADVTDPIIDVGNNVNITIRNVGIVNTSTANGIDIAAGAAASSVRLEYCSVENTGGSGNAVTLTTTGVGAPSLVAYDTYFNGTDVNIAVSGAVVANVDVYDCQFATGAVITFTGANHAFDAVNCDCGGGAVTVALNAPTINMTRCNDIGVITNLINALTLEHCTTGAITNTAGTILIEHCDTGSLNSSSTGTITITASRLGAVVQGAAAGVISITNSSMGGITTGAGGTIRLYGQCYFSDIAANAGVLTWRIDPNHIKVVAGTANMKVADALTLAGAGDVITIYPGTYAVANLTMVASVNLVGTDRDQCLIVADSTTNPVINSAVTCSLSNLTIGGTNAANPAIAITANILTARDCYIYGTGVGDAVTMVAGQLDAYNSTVGAGDIDLSTDTCTLNMYFCRITTDPIDTAGAVAHVLNFEQCDLGGQSVVSAATIGTTLDMDGCTSVGTVSNAGTGAFTINASEVGTVTASLNGTIAVVGGYLGACGGATASVTWRTGALRYEVLVNMRIQDSLTAGAGGEVIIHAGTHEPPNPAAPGVALTVSADTMVRGEGFASIIQGAAGATNITQLMQLNGNNIHIKDLKMILAAGCGTGGARPNVIYATAVQQLWLENLWLVGDTSVADDGDDGRQCGVYFNNVDDSKIVDCRIEDCDRHGINLDNGSDYNTVSGNTSQGNSKDGIRIDTSLYNTISGNASQGNDNYGIDIINGSTHNILSGNTIQVSTLDGISCDGASDNNTINGNLVQGGSGRGITISGDENTITGNTVQGNTQTGIFILGTNNTITGNTVVGNDSAGNTHHGIHIQDNENTITGNQCSGNGLHGIYIYRSSYCTVTGNVCNNQNTGDGINVTGDGTDNADFNTVTGNVCTGNASNGIEIVGGVNANENIVVANNLKNNTGAGLADAGLLTQIGHNIV